MVLPAKTGSVRLKVERDSEIPVMAVICLLLEYSNAVLSKPNTVNLLLSFVPVPRISPVEPKVLRVSPSDCVADKYQHRGLKVAQILGFLLLLTKNVNLQNLEKAETGLLDCCCSSAHHCKFVVINKQAADFAATLLVKILCPRLQRHRHTLRCNLLRIFQECNNFQYLSVRC